MDVAWATHAVYSKEKWDTADRDFIAWVEREDD